MSEITGTTNARSRWSRLRWSRSPPRASAVTNPGHRLSGGNELPTAGHLASWAGATPGMNELARRVKSTKTRPGNPYPQARSIPRRCSTRATPAPTSEPSTGVSPPRRAPVKAIAVQHAILTAIWNMATNGTLYDDRGADLHPTPPDKAKHRAIQQLRRTGYHVTLEPTG